VAPVVPGSLRQVEDAVQSLLQRLHQGGTLRALPVGCGGTREQQQQQQQAASSQWMEITYILTWLGGGGGIT
jgi:hypothetical protein